MSSCRRRCCSYLKTAKFIISLSLVLSLHVQPRECVFVDICSSAEANVQGARVNISSPGYPDDANEIPISGRRCFCQVRSSSIPSNGQVQIMPIDNRHVGCSKIASQRCDRNCWSSLRISSRVFCLSGSSRNFTTSSTVPSTSRIDITYAALKSVSSFSYIGKFAFSLYVPGARELRISCLSPLTMAERFETTSSPNVVNSNNESSPSNKSHVDAPNSTGPILTSSSQISEYSIFFGVLGLIPILVVILIIASVVIVLLRKSKMRADQSSAENGLQQLTTATDDLEGEVQTPWTASAADGAGTRVRPHIPSLPPLQTTTPTKHLPERREVVGDYDTPRCLYNRHSSNYTPMELNSPISSNSSNSSSNSSSSRVNKTSFSANIYADLSQIASQRGTDNRRISIDPVVEVTDVDCVYYNSVVLAAAAANRAPRHGHASYETCYSPDGGGGARLEFQNSNANGCEFYAAIRDCGGGDATVDLSNTESLYSNEQLYCNIGQERADNNVSQINETILIENPSYAGKKAST